MCGIANLNTPVAFIIFNRPDLTARVFEAIREAKPGCLYIIADGPRSHEEKVLTDATRYVAEQVDWPCEVKKIYSQVNLGCRQRVNTGLNEVFDQEEKAIILEDDCLPHPDFFLYCETLLNYYKDSDIIGTINGTCLPGTTNHLFDATYTFSQFSIVWGWATTRKIWKMVDDTYKDWPVYKKQYWLNEVFPNQKDIRYSLNKMFDEAYAGANAWSYSLLFALLKNKRLNIYPNINLISNIGFDERATHTYQKKDYSNLPIEHSWKCMHPKTVSLDRIANKNIYIILYHWYFGKKSGIKYLLKVFYGRIYLLKTKLFPSISFKSYLHKIFNNVFCSKL